MTPSAAGACLFPHLPSPWCQRSFQLTKIHHNLDKIWNLGSTCSTMHLINCHTGKPNFHLNFSNENTRLFQNLKFQPSVWLVSNYQMERQCLQHRSKKEAQSDKKYCSESLFCTLEQLTASWQLLMISAVKWGSCFRYESLPHIACVTICASSMAARAGLNQPLLLSTSTQAWISLTAWKTRFPHLSLFQKKNKSPSFHWSKERL